MYSSGTWRLHMHVNAEAFVWYTVVSFLALGAVFGMALNEFESICEHRMLHKSKPQTFHNMLICQSYRSVLRIKPSELILFMLGPGCEQVTPETAIKFTRGPATVKIRYGWLFPQTRAMR
jgi:hypothetical protein